MTTPSAKPAEAAATRRWWVVDATDLPLGRLASKVAQILSGKHKPSYTPHVDTGDFVVVVNASQVKVTGNKANDKNYYTHSGYPGALRKESFRHLIVKHPERPIELAVKGMLPKNVLGRQMIEKLKVYGNGDHPHQAQKPEALKV
ncbi:MAG TPA: 50S ribosomal protein L13 [Polyangiaceae bacterium]|jgi:large subunit ribosomal protein L13|nr:50S ribosomal protein L13 [Polyangiaceae bacterium]